MSTTICGGLINTSLTDTAFIAYITTENVALFSIGQRVKTRGSPTDAANPMRYLTMFIVMVHAWDAYRTIESKLREKKIGWTGCLVISKNSYSADPDLCYEGTFSTTTVDVDKYRTLAIGWPYFYASRQVRTGKAILLLE